MFRFYKISILSAVFLLMTQIAVAFYKDETECEAEKIEIIETEPTEFPHHPASLIALLDQEKQMETYPSAIQQSIKRLYDFSNSQLALPMANAITRTTLNSEISTDRQALAIHFLMATHAILSLEKIRGVSYEWILMHLNYIYDYAQCYSISLEGAKERLFSQITHRWMSSVMNQESLDKRENLIVASEGLYALSELATGTNDWAEPIVHLLGTNNQFPPLSTQLLLCEENGPDMDGNPHEPLLKSIERYHQKNKKISFTQALIGNSILKNLMGGAAQSKLTTHTLKLFQSLLKQGSNAANTFLTLDPEAMLEKSDGISTRLSNGLGLWYKFLKTRNAIKQGRALFHHGPDHAEWSSSIEQLNANATECLNPPVLLIHIQECPLNDSAQNWISQYRLSESNAPTTADYANKISAVFISGLDFIGDGMDKILGIELLKLANGVQVGRFFLCSWNFSEKSYQVYTIDNQQKLLEAFKLNNFSGEGAIEGAISLGILESITHEQAKWNHYQMITATGKLLREIAIGSIVWVFPQNPRNKGLACFIIFLINVVSSLDGLSTHGNNAFNQAEASKALPSQFKALSEAIKKKDVSAATEEAKQIATKNRLWASDFVLSTLCEGSSATREEVRAFLQTIIQLSDQQINDLCVTHSSAESKDAAAKWLLSKIQHD